MVQGEEAKRLIDDMGRGMVSCTGHSRTEEVASEVTRLASACHVRDDDQSESANNTDIARGSFREPIE